MLLPCDCRFTLMAGLRFGARLSLDELLLLFACLRFPEELRYGSPRNSIHRGFSRLLLEESLQQLSERDVVGVQHEIYDQCVLLRGFEPADPRSGLIPTQIRVSKRLAILRGDGQQIAVDAQK